MPQAAPPPLRVLFVEDSPSDVELISRELTRHGFQIESRAVDSRGGLQAALKTGAWDVVLSDHALDGLTYGDALRLLRNQDADIPFIIVSGTLGEETAVEAMRAGAQDYILKHNLQRLGPAIEREMREAANRRMQRSAQAAMQSAEQRFLHAQRMESVGRLASGIAHDFNNLLTLILGFTEFLLERLPPGEEQQDVMEIRLAAERATRLTRQLLAFSRQQVLERRVIDLSSALTELQPMIDRLAGDDVECRVELPDAPMPVLIDPGQFEQVIMNLAITARDAMPAGGRLTLRLGPATLDALGAATLDVPPGAYVMLAVSDTGEGVDPEALEYIFEPFFTAKASGRGSGLGLSTVFGTVRQSGGAIVATSAPKQGTTFTIYLPMSAEPCATQAGLGDAAATTSRPIRILLAEDEEGVRSFLSLALTRAGHRVVASASGREAVEAGRRLGEPIDLLIADVVMPGLSGPEVADQLRPVHPEMRALFLSGYANVPERVITEPGAFLQKPFSVETLLAKIQDRLAASR